MLGVEAERMADHVVGHHPTMLGAGKTKHAVDSNSRLEDRMSWAWSARQTRQTVKPKAKGV